MHLHYPPVHFHIIFMKEDTHLFLLDIQANLSKTFNQIFFNRLYRWPLERTTYICFSYINIHNNDNNNHNKTFVVESFSPLWLWLLNDRSKGTRWGMNHSPVGRSHKKSVGHNQRCQHVTLEEEQGSTGSHNCLIWGVMDTIVGKYRQWMSRILYRIVIL